MTVTLAPARTFGRRHKLPQALVPSALADNIARALRKDVRLPACITAEHLHGSLSCAVANISASGALLRLPVDLSA